MNTIKLALTACIALLTFSSATAQDQKEDKIATVSVQRLLAEFHKAKTLNKTFEAYQAEVVTQDKSRQEVIKTAAEEANKLAEEAKAPNLSDVDKAKIYRQAQAKRREAQDLNKDRLAWRQRKAAALTDQAKVEYDKLRQEILTIIRQVGDEEGYDYIFDNSGTSGVGISVLVYTKDATDLTGVLLERINKDAPAE